MAKAKEIQRIEMAKAKKEMEQAEAEKREAQKALNRALGHIRREIARRISLRHVPEFSVVYDDTAERASRIDSLINSLGSSDE